VFIDETAVTTKMTRTYGRAPLGERLVAKVPYGHWKTLTLVAALRVDGVTAPYVIDAPWMADRSSPMSSRCSCRR
jgi:hypothetical protein